jgi:hypothetical protein
MHVHCKVEWVGDVSVVGEVRDVDNGHLEHRRDGTRGRSRPLLTRLDLWELFLMSIEQAHRKSTNSPSAIVLMMSHVEVDVYFNGFGWRCELVIGARRFEVAALKHHTLHW